MRPISPDVTVFHVGGKHEEVKPVNAAAAAINEWMRAAAASP
jgi:hypothetical protein